MRVFNTYQELRAALDLPDDDRRAFRFLPEFAPAGFVCATCKKTIPFPFSGGCTGYGLDNDKSMHCYACCNAKDRAKLLTTTGPFYVYLNSDGTAVISWPGGELGRVHCLTVSRNGWHGAEIARFHVRDVHGQWWQGRGAGRGMACTLRRLKHVPTYAQSWAKPFAPFIFGNWHAWQSGRSVVLSDESAKKLQSFDSVDDCINALYLSGEKGAARALNTHAKGQKVKP